MHELQVNDHCDQECENCRKKNIDRRNEQLTEEESAEKRNIERQIVGMCLKNVWWVVENCHRRTGFQQAEARSGRSVKWACSTAWTRSTWSSAGWAPLAVLRSLEEMIRWTRSCRHRLRQSVQPPSDYDDTIKYLRWPGLMCWSVHVSRFAPQVVMEGAIDGKSLSPAETFRTCSKLLFCSITLAMAAESAALLTILGLSHFSRVSHGNDDQHTALIHHHHHRQRTSAVARASLALTWVYTHIIFSPIDFITMVTAGFLSCGSSVTHSEWQWRSMLLPCHSEFVTELIKQEETPRPFWRITITGFCDLDLALRSDSHCFSERSPLTSGQHQARQRDRRCSSSLVLGCTLGPHARQRKSFAPYDAWRSMHPHCALQCPRKRPRATIRDRPLRSGNPRTKAVFPWKPPQSSWGCRTWPCTGSPCLPAAQEGTIHLGCFF